MAGDTKTCPDCAEEVKSAANICRFCGYQFERSQLASVRREHLAREKGKNRRTVAVLIAIGAFVVWGLSDPDAKKDRDNEPVSQAKAEPPTKADGSDDKSRGSSILYDLMKDDEPKDEAAEAERQAKEDAACRQDIQCWGDKKVVAAGFDCEKPIERLAQYDHEWTDGWLGTKMSRFAWNDREKGIVAYWGDSIKFQNGFGAWQQHQYRCIYDTINEKVIEVTASPGSL